MIRAFPAVCPTCDASQQIGRGDEMELRPCQGSDTCTARLCRGCRVHCFLCGLYACAEHSEWFEGERCCELCIAAAKEQDVELEMEEMGTK